MVERFYSMSHLSTAQLREMCATYRKQGWTDSEYQIQNPANAYPPELPETDILLSIDAGDEEPFFVYMPDHEDEEEGEKYDRWEVLHVKERMKYPLN